MTLIILQITQSGRLKKFFILKQPQSVFLPTASFLSARGNNACILSPISLMIKYAPFLKKT